MSQQSRVGRWMAVVISGWFGLGVCMPAHAGNLDSPAPPTDPGSAMYTLDDVYNRLDTGTPGAPGVFAEPAAGPGSTGHTLDQVMGKAPATNAAAAAAAEVLTGKTYWGLLNGAWGQQTGSMANRGAVTVTPGTTQQAIDQGYHNGTGSVEGDADLVTGNIRAGANVFGVAGKTEVVDTTTGDAVAADVKSGKKAWVDGSEVTGTGMPAPVAKTGAGDLPSYTEVAGEDGHASMRRGVAWPSPRFTDNTDGTVTDNLTGLIWLKKANYINTDYPAFDADGTAGDGRVTWQHALDFVAAMNAGTYGNCGQTDWRLPNVQELQSMIDYNNYSPALPTGHPFTGVVSSYYWSSTTYAVSTTYAWYVYLGDGRVFFNDKSSAYYVWPVRGGQ